MKPELHTEIALARDFPEYRLKRGDMATPIDFVPHPTGGEEDCILEVSNVLGKSVDVVTVPLSAIEPQRPDQIPSARPLERIK